VTIKANVVKLIHGHCIILTVVVSTYIHYEFYFPCHSDIIEEIGVCGDLKSETMALLLENDIDFSPCDVALYQYFPHSPFQIPEEEIQSRCDLR
jgi:exoribonuclease R